MSRSGQIFVKPVEGRTVRDPRTRINVPAEGMYVPAGDPHWMASLNFGDLTEAEPSAAAEPDAAAHDEPTPHDEAK